MWLWVKQTHHVDLDEQHSEGETLSQLFQTLMDVVWVQIMVTHTEREKEKLKHPIQYWYMFVEYKYY